MGDGHRAEVCPPPMTCSGPTSQGSCTGATRTWTSAPIGQAIMFGRASDETEDCMPLTHSMPIRSGKTLTDVRKCGVLWWLRPDGQTQVTTGYVQKADGSVVPQKIHTVVFSTRQAKPRKATSLEEMNKLLEEKLIRRTRGEIILKNGKPALTLYVDHTHLYIDPPGKFITHGGWGAHGGGAFSDKDPTKVDRPAACICRQMAKAVVKGGLTTRTSVQLSDAFGVTKPLLCRPSWRPTVPSAASHQESRLLSLRT